jgi:hypothetical protein
MTRCFALTLASCLALTAPAISDEVIGTFKTPDYGVMHDVPVHGAGAHYV